MEKEKLKLYMHYERDYDECYYLFKNYDVISYSKGLINELDNIINKYLNLIDEESSLFIKGNYLFFTYKGIKYYHNMSFYLDEEDYIHDIIRELKAQIPDIKDIVYKYGESD